MQTATDLYENPLNPFRDVESERGILQSLFLNPELIYTVSIKTSDFTNPEYAMIYEAMLKLYTDGIVFELKPIIDSDPRITASTVFDISDSAFTAANINYHIKRVKTASFNRLARNVTTQLQEKVGEDDFLKEVDNALIQLHDFKTEGVSYHSVPKILETVRTQISEAKKTQQYGVPTGFDRLNEAIIGLCPRHLVLLGGYTSYGKSTFMSQLIDDVCRAGHSVLVFSVEDSKEDKLIRLLATKTSTPIRAIVRSQCEESKYQWAESEIESYSLAIYDDIYTLPEMDMKIRKHKMQGGVDIVAIDFVQNIQIEGEGIYDRMSQVAIVLQQMAKKHNVCIFALSQVSADEKGSIKLRGAQELASAADIVLWIDRDATNEKRDFTLIVRKNRPFGKTGKINFTFNESWTNIREV